MSESLFKTLEHNDRVEDERLLDDGRAFVSDYNGSHPFVTNYLGDLARKPPAELGDVSRYAYINSDVALLEKIAQFHTAYDGVEYCSGQVIPCAGASAALSTLCLWLKHCGHDELFYLPPLYYKFAFWLRHLRIAPVSASRLHAYQSGFGMHLPDRRTALILTDPVWHAGYCLSEKIVKELRAWQLATGSTIIVDGTFQYMRWNKSRRELCASLDPDRTYRLVCPTKFLSIHGYRAAHLLVPEYVREQLADFNLDLHGEMSVSDKLFAHRACDLMMSEGNGQLLDFIMKNFDSLKACGAVINHVEIHSGYFLFSTIRKPKSQFIFFGQDCYELGGHPDHVRVSLLNRTGLSALTEGLHRSN